jgi:2-oxoglutarate ferredoxin oxidoreductase subunit beta
MMREAVQHEGFSLVDIFQPCVTFNKINTWDWYRERVYHIDKEYDPTDRVAAFQKSLEWGERIPLGVIYRNGRPTYEEQNPVIKDKPLFQQAIDLSTLENTVKEFY